MTHDPKEVLEAMCNAAVDSALDADATWTRCLDAALRAALAMGWKMVPMEMTDEMSAPSDPPPTNAEIGATTP